MDKRLDIKIGKTKTGKIVEKNLDKSANILISGEKGSGKSNFLHNVIKNLTSQFKSPKELKFILVNSKKEEFEVYKKSPYLAFPIIRNYEDVMNSINWLFYENERRFNIFGEANKSNIYVYNKTAKEKLPYIVYIVDDITAFKRINKKEYESKLKGILWLGRTSGIFTIVATSSLYAKYLSGLIRVNFFERIVFKTKSAFESRNMICVNGAEKLKKPEEMFYYGLKTKTPKKLIALKHKNN